MIKLAKVVVLALLVLFTTALISPIKAVYIVNIVSSYAYIATSLVGNAILELAIKLRSSGV